MSAQATTTSAEEDVAISIALVGNPGTGKSTILNSLIGEVAFESGVNIGPGMTRVLQGKRDGAVMYYDTPGLADAKIKEQAGKELDKLLRENQALKIIFVVTLEAGRARPQDAATIKLVLDAIDCEVNNRFGIIINKVSKKVAQKMGDGDAEAIARGCLTQKYWTSHWHYCKKDSKIDDEDNMMLDDSQVGPIARFLLAVPDTKPVNAQTTPIETRDVDKILEDYEQAMSKLYKASQEERKHLTEKMEKEKQEAKEREGKLRADIAKGQWKSIIAQFAGSLLGTVGLAFVPLGKLGKFGQLLLKGLA